MRLPFLILGLLAASSVLAQVNVAASANGGTASQSSIWTPAAVAENAIDGNNNGIWNANGILTLNHTNIESGAWLKIFFDSTYQIDSVNLWNRLDGLGGRLNPFSVRLFDGASMTYESTGNIFADTINDGLSYTEGMSFLTGGVLADSMEVKLDGTNYLHLAEVEAFAAPVPEPGTMLALGAAGLLFFGRRRKA